MSFLAFFILSLAHAQPVCSTNFDISPSSWVNEIERINRCRPLTDAGDVRVFNASRGENIGRVLRENESLSGSAVTIEEHRIPNDHKGTLKYLGSNQYEMVMQLNFTKVPNRGTVEPAEMMNRVRNCLEISRPGLRGPNGAQLNIIAVDAAQAARMGDFAPPAINIDIIEPGVRGRAEEYSSDFNCATIVHELLHFLGLCDEYIDGGDDVNASSCRALGPANSVMSEGKDVAFDDSVGEIGSCEVPADNPALPALQSSDPVAREVALRKRHYDVGNFSRTAVRLPPLPAARTAPTAAEIAAQEPKALYCTESAAEMVRAPTSIDGSFNRLLTNQPTVIEIESFLDPQRIPSGSGWNYYKTKLRCDCTGKPANCTRFLELMRPMAESIASPSRRVYRCPGEPASRRAPSNFSQRPGTFSVAGNTVHYRNRPSGRPMLHPAHFQRIINGPCHIASTPELVRNYNECARYSVKSSLGIDDPNATDANQREATACASRPAMCNSPDQWLGRLPTTP
jgi:hypothetical protein